MDSLEIINHPQPGTSKSLNIEEKKKKRNNEDEDSSKKASQEYTSHTINQKSKTLKRQVQSQGNQMGIHGAIYQTKLFMLFLYRGVSRKYSFRLGTEIKEANKFDDLVFEYTNDGRKEYRFIQAKHRFDESKKITADNLLTESDGDYSLTKYFFSYIDSKKEKLFKDGLIKDVTICTNIDFDLESLKRAKIELNEMQDLDDILDVRINTKQSERYKFGKSITSLLRPKLQNYNLTRLARRLSDCFLKNISLEPDDINDIFISYHFALAEDVINIESKNFHDKFIKNDISLSETGKKFRELFLHELNTKSSNRFEKPEDINEAIRNKLEIFSNRQVGLNLSKNFRKQTENKGWPVNPISDNEIEDFLNHLVFAVNQPNQEDLDEILKEEMGKEFGFNYKTRENLYNKFFTTNLKWLLSKDRDRFLSYTEGRDFLENARNGIPIWFDIKEPIDSFILRPEQLERMHTALQSGCTAAISGLGGIGKSELTRKYVHKHSEDYDNKIIWINAESYQSLSESFERLAQDILGISTINLDGKKRNIRSIVEDVYKFFSKGKCLFIFDNAEKSRTQDIDDESIDTFLPPLPSNVNKPYVLITSRNQQWGTIEVIPLDVFTENEAIDFIRKALTINDDSQSNEIQELVRTFQYFPLALQQAVAYIKEKDTAFKNIGSGFGIDAYLKRYREETKKLLDFKFPSDSGDLYTKTTYTTWKITIDKIKDILDDGQEAGEILDTAAYLDAENIYARWFLTIDLVNNSEEKLASAIQLLRDYSMIDLGQKQAVLNIHRLVQQVSRIYLKEQSKEEETLVNVFNLLERIYHHDSGKLEDYPQKRHLLPHLKTFLSHIQEWIPRGGRFIKKKQDYIIKLSLWINN